VTGEVQLVRSIFGDAIDYALVRLRRRKWFPFQPANIAMAPLGHIHFHPEGTLYCEDFSKAKLSLQGLFIHEMTHVWQVQAKGLFHVLLMRHPFSRYTYQLKPGRPFSRYGIEQQAEIVRHAFLLRKGATLADKPPLAVYEKLLPFST
jgi:hypothetical protein